MATPQQKRITQLEDQLQSSKTALNPGTKPTAEDIAADQALRKAKSSQDIEEGKKMKNLYYGSSQEETAQKKGLIGTALHTLGAPTYAVAGVVETALGKGTRPGLDNVLTNIQEGGTFGDVLRSSGVPNMISVPLGFGLDLIGDPINWFTAGTATLVPRVAKGLTKAGVKGAATGAKTWGLKVGEDLGRLVPGLEKAAFGEGPAASRKLPTFFRNLSNKAAEGAKEYDIMTDSGVAKMLTEEAKKKRLLQKVSDQLDLVPQGDTIKKLLKYSPTDDLRARIAATDEAAAKFNLGSTPMDDAKVLKGRSGAYDFMKSAGLDTGKLTHLEKTASDAIDIAQRPNILRDGSGQMTTSLEDEAAALARDRETVRETINRMQTEFGVTDAQLRAFEENLSKKLVSKGASVEEATETAQQRLLDLFATLKTDMKAADKWVGQSLVKSPKFFKSMETYAKVIGLFKVAKVPGNLPGATTAAAGGNLALTGMAGIDIANAGLAKNLKWALDVSTNRELQAYRELLDANPEWREVLEKYGNDFKWVFGADPALFLRGEEYVKEVVAKVADEMARKGLKGNADSLMKDFLEAQRGVDKNIAAKASVFAKAATKKEVRKAASKLTSPVTAALETGVSPFFAQELTIGTMGRFIKNLEKSANEGSLAAKIGLWYMTVPGNAFSKIDQVYKLGLAKHLSGAPGITEAEMQKLIPRYKITQADAVQLKGRNRWTLTPMKSMEIANDVYMNYQAMPGFVRMMRILPVIGSPFASFTYGAGAQTLKTAIHNPAYFSKVQNFLHEFGGDKSPLEKQALDTPYYSWMDQPSMAKIPFFKDNPLYLSLANMVPYYSMSLLSPPSRDYGSKFGGKVAEAIDRSPFFKTPEGQMILDYFVMPQLLGEAQGVFGQPMYPQDAGFGRKAAAFATSAAEAVVPTSVGALGAVPNLVPEGAIPYIPSYRFRQLQYGTQGKTSVGIPSKEDPVSRVARTLSAMAGLPVFRMDLTYAANKK